MKNISQLVIQALGKTLNISDFSRIKVIDNLKDDLGLDSLTSLVFLMNLEELIPGFCIDPDTLDVNSLENVSTITQYVQDQLNTYEESVA